MAAGFRSAPGEAPACYLGLLTPSDGFRVYGYGTNTKARLLLAMEGGTMREEEVQAVSRVAGGVEPWAHVNILRDAVDYLRLRVQSCCWAEGIAQHRSLYGIRLK